MQEPIQTAREAREGAPHLFHTRNHCATGCPGFSRLSALDSPIHPLTDPHPMFTKTKTIRGPLRLYYDRLFEAYGPQHWWPAEDRFEVIIGAILTQNTTWNNVERAIANLKREGLMSPKALHRLPVRRLGSIIRPSGYYNVKAVRIKSFLTFLIDQYGGDLEKMFKETTKKLRRFLLDINGIGPETADSILLYAGGRPIFVIDAYTRRILSRHGLVSPRSTYGVLQDFFMKGLPPSPRLYNEYHALLIEVGKHHCRKEPICSGCPLERFLIGKRPKSVRDL